MAGLHLHRSNHVEALAADLVALLADPLPNPLQAEMVVVQSLGMRRWLSFQIAGPLGITMNCDFPFIAEFAQRVFREALAPDRQAARAFSREALLWRVLHALPPLLPEAEFASLRRYIGADEASPVKEFQLARQVATVLDQYMAYTPERLLRWDAGEESHWQARLWRDLSGETAAHPPALLRRLKEKLDAGAVALPGLPPRISVFGIASLPPFFLQLLAETCRAVEVHLFLFEPTDQYWGDTRSAAEQQRILRQARPGQTAEDLHLEAGNELLVSFGRAGRAFSVAVQDLEPETWHERFQPPSAPMVLGQVQAEIFELRGEGERPAPLPTGDGSIQIHCCHGPMREVEVLHDHLLDLFQRLPGLTPKDVLVTMPGVETHAPYIEAVFGSPESEAMRIPFTIADRSVRAESGVARAFLGLLDLHGSRFSASSVLDLLESRAVRERFEIEESDVETIRLWVCRNNIRWGIDAAHRESFGLPRFPQNTWRAGLDRLLLGYALPGDGETLFEGILPDGAIEGGAAELLGHFAEFAESLFELVPRLSAPRSVGGWSEFLGQILDTFFAITGDDADEVLAIRKSLSGLAEWEEFHSGEVPFPALRTHLATLFTETEGSSGFLAGHVTFCSLKPMRSIPFRVICMLGMGDGAFPRRETPIAFDLLTEHGGAAGRSKRDEDRQLFLESLLSARDVFYLSYTGLSTKDNSEAPPSVVVSELIDYLAEGDPDPEARQRIVTHHRLQPFSTAYFTGDDRLFSFSEENSRAFTDAKKAKFSTGPCAEALLPEPEIDWRALDFRSLTRFFSHPPKYFLEQRVNARLPEADEGLSDCEPLALDSLERWSLAQTMARSLIAGQETEALETRLRAEGLLPAGHFGGAQVDETQRAVRPLLEQMAGIDLGAALPPLALTAAHEEWQVQGTLEDLHENGHRIVTGWPLTPKNRLQAWLAHLLLNAGGMPRDTFLFGPDEVVRYAPRPDALALLADLVAIFREGQRRPLPFFAKASHEFARRTLRPRKKESDAAMKARQLYDAQEADDPHNELCFRHLATPCDEEWQTLALRVWRPILEQTDG